MKNFIPIFIQKIEEEGKLQKGEFTSSTMFMDISGFTPMTEALMKQGKEGAEVLSSILNTIFEPIIDAVYDRGGFVSGFAGDAMTVIFPDNNNTNSHLNTIFTAKFINELFRKNGTQKTRLGNYELYVKLGLSYGNVKWGILGTDKYKTYYMRGEAIDGCAHSEHHCEKMDIVIDGKMKAMFLDTDIDYVKSSENLNSDGEETETYFKLTKLNLDEDKTIPYQIPELKRRTLKKFLLDAVLDFDQVGEFRNIVSVFISFKEPDSFSELNALVTKTLELAYSYGGYFNTLDFGDKGGTMLILFGAPLSYEDNIHRALRFILLLRKEFNVSIRAGLVEGIVYTGIVGIDKRCTYTALGDTVNMSARFMMKADWGKVWISSQLAHKIKSSFEYKDIGKHSFKGKSEPIQVYELRKEKKQISGIFEGEIVGRDDELDKLMTISEPLTKSKFCGLIYIYGDAGTGKSRLVYELMKKISARTSQFVLQCDDILRKSLNPFIYAFERYFEQEDLNTPEEKRKVFDAIYDIFLGELKSVKDKRKHLLVNELDRVRSIIASVIDIYWEGSLYSTIEKKDIPEVTNFAIKSFFKAQSLIRPLVMLFEDIHWIDESSKETVKILTREIEEYPIMIMAVSRYNDDGSKPVFGVDTHIKTHLISISNLTNDAGRKLCKNLLKEPLSDKLFELIKTKTGNNPFFIEQLCTYLEENQLLTKVSGANELKDESVEIPMEINSILVARIDRLSSELKEAVQIGSILGREFDVKIIYEMLEVLTYILNVLEKEKKEDAHLISTKLKAEEIRSVLSEGKTEKVWTNLTEIRYIFKHALLMDVVYGMQLKQRLRSLHRIAGEAIKNLFTGDKSKYIDIARHYQKAEMKAEALEYFIKAGDYAKEEYNNDKAFDYFSKALELSIETNGENHLETAKLYSEKGIIYNRLSQYDKSIEHHQKAKEIRIKLLGERHKDVASNYNFIGFAYLKKNDYDKAREYFSKARDIRVSVLGKVNENVAQTYINIGTSYLEEAKYDEAKKSYEEALAVNIELYGETNAETGLSYNDISMVHWLKGENNEAIDYLKKAEKILDKTVGEKHLFMSIVYVNYGKVYWSLGKLDKSIEYSQKAYDIRRNILGENHFETAFPINNIGVIYWLKGEHKKALQNFEKTLSILYELVGRKHMQVAVVYQNVAVLNETLGNYKEALKYLDISYDIFKASFGEEHPYIAKVLSNLGRVYISKEEYEKGLFFIQKSIDMRIKFNDKNSLGYDYTFGAYAYAITGQYEEALKYALAHLKNIVEIESDVEKGRTHLSIAITLSKAKTQLKEEPLSKLMKEISEMTTLDISPEAYFDYVVKIAEETKHFITLIPALYHYSKHLEKMGKSDIAKEKLEKAKAIAKKQGILGELRKIEAK